MVGFSFKMLKTGTRYTPGFAHHDKNLPKDAGERRAPRELRRCDRAEGCQMENGFVLSHSSGIECALLRDNDVGSMQQGHKKRCREVPTIRSESPLEAWKPREPSLRKLSCDAEASFAVNLLPDGFSIEKPTEKGKLPAPAYEVMDFLYPYDRTSETFLRAIDGGWLPGDLLEDIPCKYFDGCVICELRDYRDSIPSTIESAVPPISCKGALGKWMPVVQRVLLQPSTETIVKDMASIVDNSWTYRELLEVEARVLKAIQPSLYLNRAPEVGKLASANTDNLDYFSIGFALRHLGCLLSDNPTKSLICCAGLKLERYSIPFHQYMFLLKLNIGCSALGRYRSPNEVFRDRRLRISAAARAQLKAKWLIQRRTSSSLQIAETPVSVLSTPSRPESPVADAEPMEETTKWSTPQVRGAGHAALFRPAPPSAISIPSCPLSPNTSTPVMPVTPLTLTSASGHEATSGGLGRISPMLEIREDKENGATASGEAKSFNLEQAKVEKLQTLQQKVHEETEAKDLTKKQLTGKQQHLYQNSLEKRVSEILIHCHSHAPQTPQQPEGTLQEKDILPTFLEIKTALANDEPQEPGVGRSIAEQQDSSVSLEQTFSEGPEIAKIQQESQAQDRANEKNCWHGYEVEGSERDQEQYHEEQGARHQEPLALLQQWPILTSHYWQQLGSSNPNVKFSLKAEEVQIFTEELVNLKQRCHLPVQAPQRTSKLPLKFDKIIKPTLPMLLPGNPTRSSMCPMTNLRAVPLMPTALTTFASERAHTQVMASSEVGSSENMKQMALIPQMLQLQASRRRSSSPPKSHLLASPRSLHSVAAGTRRVCNTAIKVEQSTLVQPHMLVPQQSKANVDTQALLLTAIRRHGLHNRKKPVEQLPPPNRTPPSFHMMSVALSETQEDVKEPKDQCNMASSLVGGNVNSRKTRILQFTKTEHSFRGFGYRPALHHMQRRLVLCGRAKDSLVEAIVQMDDIEDEATPHHHVLPTMANAHVADRFAKQYCALLEKEGYELTADEVHLSASRGSSSSLSSGHHVPTPISIVDNPLTGNLGASPRSVSCPRHLQIALPSTLSPMQPLSLSQMSTNSIAPPQSASNWQILSNSLKVTSVSKPMELDATIDSQCQQLQQHHQMQRQPTQQLATQLDPRQYIKPPMVTHSLQYNQLQYHLHQQAQWQHHHQMLQQRKLLLPGSLSSLSAIGGVGIQVTRAQSSLANMVGLASMKSMAMGDLNTMGLSSVGGMSGLAMGSSGQSNNMMGQHLRSVATGQSPIQASKGGERLITVPTPFVRTTTAVDRFSGLGNVAQMMSRSGLAPTQRATVAGIAPPQSYYLDPPQLNARQLNVASLGAVVGGPPSSHLSSRMSSGNLVGLDLQKVTRVPGRVPPQRRPGMAQLWQQGQNPQ